jgi:AcrR family transcriptional regulator
MPRWEPDARVRFVDAALHLFSEQGYDETTVAQITERAGLTKSTFFRHFSDKREVLAAGQETLSALLVDGIAGAPPEATPLAAVAAGLENVATTMTSFNRELAPRIAAVIATSTELQERSALKQVGLSAAMADALRKRGVPSPLDATAAELGTLAFKEAFSSWTRVDNTAELADLMTESLDRLRATLGQLG